ncbi:MAG: glycosyltransferase involved in cell wall biosynthesis [Chitinophagales bacterium]|jgi:glycosyltransferase involved in cell wall biosynthesis
MEFSILIPVYNTHIHDLASTLYEQANRLSANFQILFIDDCSELSISYINQKVKSRPEVEYDVLTENIGRAAIRNLLFDKAKYENCIIMDGDVSIHHNDFIAAYLEQLKEGVLLVGGHYYQDSPPKEDSKYLHWNYGRSVESRSIQDRKMNPYLSFMTSNFACTKSTFESLKFEESIKGYGHEDTLFGIQAQQKNNPIIHLDNAVRHDGLDNLEVFLAKQKQAVLALKQIYSASPLKKELKVHSKLVRWASRPLPFFLLKAFKGMFHRKLEHKNANLFYLQVQKLLWWHYG